MIEGSLSRGRGTRTEQGEPEQQEGKCVHCLGGRYVLDEVETTLGKFEDVSYLCPGCCGTGRAMTKAEREEIKAGRR